MAASSGSGLVSFRMENFSSLSQARLGGRMSSLNAGLGPAKDLDFGGFGSAFKPSAIVTQGSGDLDQEVFVHTPTYSEVPSDDEQCELDKLCESDKQCDANTQLHPFEESDKHAASESFDDNPFLTVQRQDSINHDEIEEAAFSVGDLSENSEKSTDAAQGIIPNEQLYSPVPSNSPSSEHGDDDGAAPAETHMTNASCDASTSAEMPSATLEDKAVGCMLGVLCGDVLGTAYEGWTMGDILRAHPNGVTDFKYTRLTGYGIYTGDMGLAIGVLLGLLRIGCCNAKQCADEYCQLYKPQRGYTDDTGDILHLLCEGVDYRETATRFEPEGSFGNSAAVRVAPIGLAYRNARPEVIHSAVRAALLCSHVHPLGIDGAYIQASAVAWMCKQVDGSSACSPAMLVAHLLLLARTNHMFQRLSIIADHLKDLMHLHKGGVTDWGAYLESPAFNALEQVAALLAPAIQGSAPEAVAVGLLVTACHWHDPEAAIVTAVHLGGCTSCIAGLVGGLVGALHGWRWVPLRWFKSLENGAHGRDVIINLARQLKLKDIRECSAPPLPTMRTKRSPSVWFRSLGSFKPS